MRALLAALLLAEAAHAASSRPEPENTPRVYQWETAQEGWAGITLWNTWVAKSDADYGRFAAAGDRSGLFAHALELEYGLTDRWTIGGYADLEQPGGGRLHFTGARLETRYRLFDRFSRWVNPALYLELIWPRRASGAPQELEARVILEKDLGDVRIALNPILTKALSGDETGAGMGFGLAAGIYYRRYWRVQPGLELFANLGPIGEAPSIGDQPWLLSPAVDVRFSQNLVWHLGAGFGLTSASDRFVVRSLLAFEFGTVRPGNAQR